MKGPGGTSPRADRVGAIEALWRELYDGLVDFGVALGLQRADACDVVAGIFAGLLSSEVDLATVEAGYLFRAVRNRASNFRRGQVRYRAAMEAWALERPHRRAAAPHPHRVLERRRISALLREAVMALPDRQREVFVCRYFEGNSYDEIAGRLGVTTNNVNKQLRRARKRLRRFLVEGDLQERDAI